MDDMDESLHQAMLNRLEEGRLPCNQAFAIAQIRGLEPERVGLAANDVDTDLALPAWPVRLWPQG